MPSDAARKVKAFFDSYREAFERLDAPAIADHFAYPSHITSDADANVVLSVAAKDDWITQLERLLSGYRAIGFHSARALDLALVELSPRTIEARVHWELQDAAGQRIYDFDATYTLANIDDALRISAIADDEIPKFRQALARVEPDGNQVGAKGGNRTPKT
jgi:hypothetical protein